MTSNCKAAFTFAEAVSPRYPLNPKKFCVRLSELSAESPVKVPLGRLVIKFVPNWRVASLVSPLKDPGGTVVRQLLWRSTFVSEGAPVHQPLSILVRKLKLR